MKTVSIEIPKDILLHSKLQGDIAKELKKELAVHLYSSKLLSWGNAVKLSGLSLIEFHNFLGDRKIPRHYDTDDLYRDLENVKKIVDASGS